MYNCVVNGTEPTHESSTSGPLPAPLFVGGERVPKFARVMLP